MDNFNSLISRITETHISLQSQAINSINQLLTIRNWVIGYYIVEFEQHGEDRAEYGQRLMDALSEKLKHIKGVDRRSLFRFRMFYLTYPQIGNYLLQSKSLDSLSKKIQLPAKVGTAPPLFSPQEIVGTVSPLSVRTILLPPDKIINKISWSHIELLLNISDETKRSFYEVECIKATWSVRELERQIASLYFERSGLSTNPQKMSELANQNTVPQHPADIIKNIYAFDFLDLHAREVVKESDLETALLDHLHNFILELGNGFCFEARQKRILIGETYYFIDLVFYHRILKCHVLIELKIGAFEHGDIGQLNTYLNYFKEEIIEATDNQPVGILLVAEKDHALVKYATAGMDKHLFVQQYLINLPAKDLLEKYIETELRKL